MKHESNMHLIEECRIINANVHLHIVHIVHIVQIGPNAHIVQIEPNAHIFKMLKCDKSHKVAFSHSYKRSLT